MLPMRFRTILRRKHFSRAQLPALISQPTQERSFYNFHARPLPIFVIWPKYATCAISRDSETTTSFARPIVHTNVPSFYNFRAGVLPIFVIWPKYATCAISRGSETATFFVRTIAHANIPTLPGELLL